MIDHAISSMLCQSWDLSSEQRGIYLLERKGVAQPEAQFLDEVPVMLATVLGLELLLREPCIDLRLVSDLVLSDVRATIRILGMIARDYENEEHYPTRMGNCIASLEVGAWFNVVSAQTFACEHEHSATTMIWRHCRLIAQYAQLIAESLDDISAEDAYLVGLLHEMGAIATVLGWPKGTTSAAGATALFTLESALPSFVLAAMRSFNDSCASGTWRSILATAHELAGGELDLNSSLLQGSDSA